MQLDYLTYLVGLNIFRQQVFWWYRRIKRSQTSFMPHEFSDRQGLFAIGSKLRPIVSDARVIFKQPLAHQGRDCDRFEAFTAAKNVDQ